MGGITSERLVAGSGHSTCQEGCELTFCKNLERNRTIFSRPIEHLCVHHRPNENPMTYPIRVPLCFSPYPPKDKGMAYSDLDLMRPISLSCMSQKILIAYAGLDAKESI